MGIRTENDRGNLLFFCLKFSPHPPFVAFVTFCSKFRSRSDFLFSLWLSLIPLGYLLFKIPLFRAFGT